MHADRWLAELLHDAGRIELRHDTGHSWHSGLFDDLGLLQAEINRRRDRGNLYTTVNTPKVLAPTNDMRCKPLRDADIVQQTRLLFDFDPRRQAGRPSTDGELRAALAVRDRFATGMRSIGWPLAAAAVSGNGAHAIYRCCFHIDDETRDILRVVYTGLAADLSDEEVQFDPTVRNPARIWRLYGSLNRKGQATPDRPHRRAQIKIPSCWKRVSLQQVEQLANIYARRQERGAARPARPATRRVAGQGDYRTLDAAAWFATHGAYRRSLGGGKHAVVCPWSHEHSSASGPLSTSTVIWDATADQWPTFHCSHAHCAGRSLGNVLALWGDADAHCAKAYASC